MSLRQIWSQKYRPTELDEYLFQDKNQKSTIIKMVLEQSIPNILLSGIQGTGKTTIARLLVKELGVDEDDVLDINASKNTSVDIVREVIEPFIVSFATGEFKVIILEEADRLSPAAQKALKVITEDYTDVVRFIFTTNEENKIIPPLKSRLQQFRFKSHNVANIEKLMERILEAEGVKFDAENLSKYVSVCYPDIRKTINLIEQNSKTGTLMSLQSVASENSDFKAKMLEFIENDAWYEMKTDILPDIDPSEWEDAYRFIYENLHRSPKMSADVANMKNAYVFVAEYLYRHTLCADPLINATALIIRLSEI